MTNKTKSSLLTLLVVIMAIAMCLAGCKNKTPNTSYQFNIIHMTDSIKVYDGSRYVGQCAEKDLEQLILNDNQ